MEDSVDVDRQPDDHADDSLKVCPYCAKEYRIPYLYHHMRKQHGIYGGASKTKRTVKAETMFSCEEPGCGRDFDTKHGLTMHQSLTHERERKKAVTSTALVPVNGRATTEPTFKLSKEWRIVEDDDGTPFLLLSLSDLVADRMAH